MYAKVFTSLWDGSMRGQSDKQLVFIYLLAHADEDGTVEVIQEKVADDTGVPVARVDAALSGLSEADPRSRTDAEDGRRITPLDGRGWGWRIVNYARYRALRDREERKRQNREAQERRRQHLSASVSMRQQPSAESAQEEAEAEVEAENLEHLFPGGNVPARKTRRRADPRMPAGEPVGFAPFYQAYPRHDGRRAAAREFGRALSRLPDYKAEHLTQAAVLFAKQVGEEDRDPQFIPLPATWLSQERFREFFEEDDNAETEDRSEE